MAVLIVSLISNCVFLFLFLFLFFSLILLFFIIVVVVVAIAVVVVVVVVVARLAMTNSLTKRATCWRNRLRCCSWALIHRIEHSRYSKRYEYS